MRSDAIRPGDVIAGKYRVRAILSRSRGFLVEAFHTEFDQRLVIRVLSPHLVDEKEVERFRRETRILAKLESEHVARIIDVGTTQDGAFYFARQYLEGQDLATHLKQRGALPFAEAVLYTLQAAEAVAETHAHNIILRELQPQHLFLTQRLGGQQIKLIDFGTAKLMRDAAAPSPSGELTATSMFGLSCYSSPELVRKAKHVDVRTDVWSLGAILYRLITGRAPFEGEMASLMLAITRDAPVAPTRYRGDLPPDIDNIISWALAKDPDGRFANVYGFAHALLPFGGAEGHILVKRISEITNAAKQQQRRSFSELPPAAPSHAAPSRAQQAVDPDHPITMDGDEVLEDEPTNADPASAARAMNAGYPANARGAAPARQAEPSLDSTMFMGNEYPAPSPAAPRAPAAGVPASRPSQPVFAGAAVSMGNPVGVPQTPPAVPQPSPSQGGRPQWQPMAAPPAAAAPQVAPATNGVPSVVVPSAAAQAKPTLASQAEATTAPLFQAGSSGGPGSGPVTPRPRGPDRDKMVLAGVSGVVLALAITVGVVLVVKKGGGDESTAVASTPTSEPTTSAVASAEPAPPPPPPPPPPETAAAEPPPPADTGHPDPAAANTGGGSKRTGAAPPPANPPPPPKAKPDPAPPPPPPPPAAGGGDNGTLVAVAVGGTCAFSVNGASKGTSSSLKLSVKPGTYSVICAPAGGSSKSKSVTVASGSTAMAMFRL